VLLDSIEQMFEHYRTLTDPDERRDWYNQIDLVSKEASKYAIANEYDKMCSYLGYSGTNAYTTEDRTVYINNIPSNQLENFLEIEAERFGIIVNRLFHTELETVYEEKNRSLDNDYWKSFEAMYKTMFTEHPYGTQTVIGTIEHLKNPSITDIKAYFDKYYISNNIAVCLSGDFDPNEAIQLVDKYFSKLSSGPLDEYVPIKDPPITENREATVWGPDIDRISLGFRFDGTSSDDYIKLQVVDYLLNNNVAGLLDLNLIQKQKVLNGGTFVNNMNDYSIHTFWGEPKEEQTLEEVKTELIGQLEILKTGEFEDWLIPAVIREFKKLQMKALESNWSRCNDMVMAFTNNMAWRDYVDQLNKMEKLTKQDIVAFVNEKYSNYVAVYKKNGEDPNKKEVEKPAITKVDLDRTAQSDFFQNIQARETAKLQPYFLDYEKDIVIEEMKAGVPVLTIKNTENEIFNLYYLLETGTNENPKVKYALDYLKYLGTADFSAEEFKKEMYKLGCDFNVSFSEERIYVVLSGLNESMEEAIKLFENLLENPRGDDEVLKNMISDAHKERSDAKKEKWRILWSGLTNYAKYGPESPFTNVLSNQELNALKSDELLDIIKGINNTEHKVMYYGPKNSGEILAMLNRLHRVPESLTPVPTKKKFAALDTEQPNVFFSNYDMVQAEMVLQSRGPQYNSALTPEIQLFNEYFGGGMSSIVFQELREAQGLAYSVFSRYNSGSKVEDNDYMMAYIGTQADKQKEALDALVNLLNNLPESEESFKNAKKAILNKIESNRITKERILFNYLAAQRKNLDYDIRKDVYTRVQDMTFDDLTAFHIKYVKGKKYNIAVVGDRKKMNFTALGKYGEVKELSLNEIFGYKENTSTILN